MPKKFQKRPQQIVRYPINLYCEGKQEEIYFTHLRDLINGSNNNKKIIQLNCNNREGGSPDTLVKAAIRLCPSTQPSTAVFDNDLRNEEFCCALDLCKVNGVVCGYSNLNFDYWLVLHKIEKNPSMAVVYTTDAYANQLRKLYHLNGNADIKQEQTIQKIVEQITIDDVLRAITNCKEIVDYNKQNRQQNRTPHGVVYYDNPDFSIHNVVERIIRDTL